MFTALTSIVSCSDDAADKVAAEEAKKYHEGDCVSFESDRMVHCIRHADNGNADAQAGLGEAYFSEKPAGYRTKGMKYLKMAAAQGHKGAQEALKWQKVIKRVEEKR